MRKYTTEQKNTVLLSHHYILNKATELEKKSNGYRTSKFKDYAGCIEVLDPQYESMWMLDHNCDHDWGQCDGLIWRGKCKEFEEVSKAILSLCTRGNSWQNQEKYH